MTKPSSTKSAFWLVPLLTSLAMLLAFFLGPVFPHLESVLKPYAKYNLCVLLLINVLHINYRSLTKVLLHHPALLGYAILVKNILLPVVAFAACYLIWPAALPAAVLISGISSGFSAVSFAFLLRLAPERNLLITMGASFLVPFSLPFLLYALTGSGVEIDLLGMMLQTCWMVFVPMLLERILYFTSRFFHGWLKAHSPVIVAINLSVTAFILMLTGQGILRRMAGDFGYILLFAIFMVVLIYVFTLLFFCRATRDTQMVMLIANLVSNTGMGAVLALDYMSDLTLAIAIVHGILWNMNIIFLRIWPPLHRRLGLWFGTSAKDLL
ncbi:hypothetical protein P0082_00370 [Candidatus Haliotispira prima]|uniref:Na+-dependent transporter n=1 Tax=Candidatus Haliotispira prima TaxID=3034016 RepID=A0ABY8MIZ6_9SPIO|nr:hypothetical protein P0082_00370 [Candidatus Haliotispira prima]